MKRILLLLILFYLTVPACRNSNHNYKLVSFFESNRSAYSFGSNAEIRGIGTYESLGSYRVDSRHNVYIQNSLNLCVDKYDKQAGYRFSFGGVDHEAARYPGWIKLFTVDTNQNLIAYSQTKHKLLIFPGNGEPFKTLPVDSAVKRIRVKKIMAGTAGNLYFLGRLKKTGFQLVKLDLKTSRSHIIHHQNQKQQSALTQLSPDFDIDKDKNIYISDTADYTVYKYSSSGKLLRTFSRDFKRLKIMKRDFNLFIRPGRIEKLPNFERIWKGLKGESRFFPAILGINIDGNHLYLWSSKQDHEKKYLVDVYDLDFNYRCTSSHYNYIGYNTAIIKNGRLFSPNIGSNSADIKNAVGRFGLFNQPHRIDVFQISKKILDGIYPDHSAPG